MPIVEAQDFQHDFVRYQDEAWREVVTVTRGGEVIGGFLSAADLDAFHRMRRGDRTAFRTVDAPDDLIELIARAEYGKPAA